MNLENNSFNANLRVCYIISSFRPVIGGAERATERLSAELCSEGVAVVVLTRRQSDEVPSFEEINHVPVYRFGSSSKIGALGFGLHSLWFLLTRLKDYRIIHVENLDTPMLIGFVARILLGRKLVATIHGEVPLYDRSQKLLGRLRLKFMTWLVHHFTAISPENRKQLKALGVSSSRITLIPNGVDTDAFCPPNEDKRNKARAKLNIPSSDRVVLYLGRLADWKRVDLLLEAWARIHPLKTDQLLIVGMGSEYSLLKKQAENLKIEVRFEGVTDVAIDYLHAVDIFVLPSGIRSTATYEGLSVALIEAMSAGLAVIATDCPGNRALIKDGHSGLLFPAESVLALADNLNILLGDTELRHRLGKNARENSVKKYSISSVAQQTKRIYEQI